MFLRCIRKQSRPPFCHSERSEESRFSPRRIPKGAQRRLARWVRRPTARTLQKMDPRGGSPTRRDLMQPETALERRISTCTAAHIEVPFVCAPARRSLGARFRMTKWVGLAADFRGACFRRRGAAAEESPLSPETRLAGRIARQASFLPHRFFASDRPWRYRHRLFRGRMLR